MPDAGDAHQVSVGLFSERDRADRRAESVQKLGLQPEVAERKLPATLFWMDVDLPSGTAAPTSQDVATGADISHIEIAPCPAQALPAAQIHHRAHEERRGRHQDHGNEHDVAAPHPHGMAPVRIANSPCSE